MRGQDARTGVPFCLGATVCYKTVSMAARIGSCHSGRAAVSVVALVSDIGANVVRTNVAFAGLTAAGKTTHAQILARQLGYRYVSATELLLKLAGFDGRSDRVWFHHYSAIEEARRGDALDVELERRLLEEARNNEGIVLDTWALAWIAPPPMIRIWIESDVASRQSKCYVSQGTRPNLNLEDCLHLIEAKDGSTRDSFRRRHGFDLFCDRERYDAILDNSHLIDAPTRHHADRGIEAFAPIVLGVVEYLRDANAQRIEHICLRSPSQRRSIRYVRGFGEVA